MVVHMMAIGEETGEIEEMLDKLADYYDEEVEVTTQTVLALLEPMIIVFMAIIVVILISGDHGTNAFVIQRRWKYVGPQGYSLYLISGDRASDLR